MEGGQSGVPHPEASVTELAITPDWLFNFTASLHIEQSKRFTVNTVI